MNYEKEMQHLVLNLMRQNCMGLEMVKIVVSIGVILEFRFPNGAFKIEL